MPLLCQNEMTGPTVINLRDADPLLFESKGDPNGGDVVRAPDSAAEDVNFMRALDAGMISIQSAPESVRAQLEKQQVSLRQQRESREAATAASIDRAQNADLIQMDCIGPSPSGRGTCGVGVPVRASQRDNRAPLCGAHESLRSQFVLGEDIDAPLTDEGKTRKVWRRVGVTARETEDMQV